MGGITENPGALDGSQESCSLDVAARGGRTLDEVGQLLGVVRERVRQIEARARSKLARGSLAAIVR